MTEQQLNNLLVFIERVQTTGTQEAYALLEIKESVITELKKLKQPIKNIEDDKN
jgi:hypothetical protein